jgi:hypothetical protein
MNKQNRRDLFAHVRPRSASWIVFLLASGVVPAPASADEGGAILLAAGPVCELCRDAR